MAAKAAAQRLAKVMASKTPNDDEDEEDDDLGFRFGPPPPSSISSRSVSNNSSSDLSAISLSKLNRSPSPAVILTALMTSLNFFFFHLILLRFATILLIDL